MIRRSRPLLAVPLIAALTLSACAGGGDKPKTEGKSATDVMAAAKAGLEKTSGISVTMSTDEDPGVDYLRSASGTIVADPPGFDGTISGTVSGIPASNIDVVSTGGTVWIKIPLLGWSTDYQPKDFCAPDPATLLDPDTGVSGVLTAATGLKAGESHRDEDDASLVLTPYSGTVPGDAIREILPCTEGEDVDATFEIDGDGLLRTAEITGAFFPDADPITYRIAINEYDVTVDISAPE